MQILATAFHPTGLWPFSGSERRFCALTTLWSRSGIDTWALEPEPIAASMMEAGYRPIPVPVRGSNLLGQLLTWYLEAVPRGLAAGRRTSFDLVYATNNNVFNLVVAAALAKRLGIPCAAVVHHLRWVDYSGPTQKLTGRYNPMAFLEALGRDRVPLPGAVARAAGAMAESQLLRRFDGLLTVSVAVRNQLTGWLPEARVYTAGNALAISRIAATTGGERAVAGLYVGRLDEGKGVLDLLGVWERVLREEPHARLEIVGDGFLRPRLTEAVARADLGAHVRLHGFLAEAALERVRSSCRVFVTLSRTEGFGIAIAEALAAGLPVVAWDIPPLHETWHACPAVTLCRLGDLEAVASAVLSVLRAPPDRAATLSREASSFVRRYSWDAVAAAETEAFEQIVRRK